MAENNHIEAQSGKWQIRLLIGLLCLCLLSFIRFIDNHNSWLIDIVSHFPFQYALVAGCFLGICVFKKYISLALFAGFLFVLNMGAVVNSGNPAEAATHEYVFKIYSANIEKSNNDFSRLVSGLSKSDSDIVLLLEVTEKNIRPLKSFIRQYPYSVVNLNVGSSGTGAVLLSRFPILTHEVTKYTEFGNILISALLEISNMKVMFYGAHFPKPTFIDEFSSRSEQIISLAHQVEGESVPVIIAGDFNSTPYTPIFRRFLTISGLRDSRTGFGWLPSWPSNFPFFWLPIDHILVSPDIQVSERETEPYIGSDHYPVSAELSIARLKNINDGN